MTPLNFSVVLSDKGLGGPSFGEGHFELTNVVLEDGLFGFYHVKIINPEIHS